MPWVGGLSDQPYQLMFELSCVEEAQTIRENLRKMAEAQGEALRKQYGS